MLYVAVLVAHLCIVNAGVIPSSPSTPYEPSPGGPSATGYASQQPVYVAQPQPGYETQPPTAAYGPSQPSTAYAAPATGGYGQVPTSHGAHVGNPMTDYLQYLWLQSMMNKNTNKDGEEETKSTGIDPMTMMMMMGGMGGMGGMGMGTMGMGGMGHYGPQGGNPMNSYIQHALMQSMFNKKEEVGEEEEETSGMDPYTMMLLMGGMGGMGMGGMGGMGMGGMGMGGMGMGGMGMGGYGGFSPIPGGYGAPAPVGYGSTGPAPGPTSGYGPAPVQPGYGPGLAPAPGYGTGSIPGNAWPGMSGGMPTY